MKRPSKHHRVVIDIELSEEADEKDVISMVDSIIDFGIPDRWNYFVTDYSVKPVMDFKG